MDFNLHTRNTNSSVEQWRWRREADRRFQRVFLATAVVAAITYLAAGSLMFGFQWLSHQLEYLYGGTVMGFVIAICVVGYTIWVELKAAVKGGKAVWNTDRLNDDPSSGNTYLRMKCTFSVFTILTLGICGALLGASIALVENLKTEMTGSLVLLAITVTASCVAAVLVQRYSKKAKSNARGREVSNG